MPLSLIPGLNPVEGNTMTRSGHIKLVTIVKSGLGHPRGTADSPAVATLPSLPQGDFLLLLGTVLHPPTQLRVDGWGPHGRNGHSFIITSVKFLVSSPIAFLSVHLVLPNRHCY